MPVIRGRSTANILTPDRREQLREPLTGELSGQPLPGGYWSILEGVGPIP
jgi:hypothetical protein